jgi:hypothetical protein
MVGREGVQREKEEDIVIGNLSTAKSAGVHLKDRQLHQRINERFALVPSTVNPPSPRLNPFLRLLPLLCLLLPPVLAPTPDGDDYFADVSLGLERLVRLPSLGKGEDVADDGPELGEGDGSAHLLELAAGADDKAAEGGASGESCGGVGGEGGGREEEEKRRKRDEDQLEVGRR